MHEPIKDSAGDPYWLFVGRDVSGAWLGICYDGPDGRWSRDGGFAFAVSQVK